MNAQKIIGKLLTKEQMLHVTGGAIFKCQCQDNRANPPYRSTWTVNYKDNATMADDLNKICVLGGKCTAV